MTETAPATPTETRASRFQVALSSLTSAGSLNCLRQPVYDLAGLLWEVWILDTLTSRAQNVRRNIGPAYQGDGMRWEWELEIAPGVTARAFGAAPTLEAAAEAVARFQPEVLHHDYLDEVIWYAPRKEYWIAAIDGDEAQVFEFASERDPTKRFRWTRRWAAGAPVLALTDEGSIAGRASTLEEAMRRCVDGPDLFKAACGALVAQLRGGAAGGAA